MATSLFFIPTDQNSVRNSNELLRNTHLVNGSDEIRTEPQKNRGRKPGSKTKNQQNQKRQKLRGMSIANLERHIAEEENKKTIVDAGDMSAPKHNPKTSRLPVIVPDIVLQGFPSFGGCRSRIYCGGGVGSGKIMIDPVSSPWSSTHELSSIPNPQVLYNASNTHCDTCFKKKRLDGDQTVVRSDGGGFSKYSLIYSPINGYDHLQSCIEGNPRNGTRGVKEFEFFPRKYDNSTGKTVAVDTTVVGDCGPNTSTIDLSLKL